MEVITRKEAKAKGLEFFFTGKPCPRGNLYRKRTSNWQCQCSDCFEVRRLHAEKIYREKPEIVRERAVRHYAKNGDVLRAKRRDYHAENREAENAKKRNRRADGGELERAKVAAYRDASRESRNARARAYAAENIEVFLAKARNREISKTLRTPRWFSELDAFVVREAFHLAKIRLAATGVKWHVDHCIPLRAKKASGLHCHQNIQVIPAEINLTKRNKMIYMQPFEWMRDL